MNVYDTANKLAQELKQSEEYVNYKMAKEVLNLKPDLKKKIEEFEVAKTKKMQELYIDLIENDDAKKFFDAEMKFNIVSADVNKIIGDAVIDVLKQNFGIIFII